MSNWPKVPNHKVLVFPKPPTITQNAQRQVNSMYNVYVNLSFPITSPNVEVRYRRYINGFQKLQNMKKAYDSLPQTKIESAKLRRTFVNKQFTNWKKEIQKHFLPVEKELVLKRLQRAGLSLHLVKRTVC